MMVMKAFCTVAGLRFKVHGAAEGAAKTHTIRMTTEDYLMIFKLTTIPNTLRSSGYLGYIHKV